MKYRSDSILLRFPRKKYGQHFLKDKIILRKIAESAGAEPGDVILEIGAGNGELTGILAESGCMIFCSEIDEGLVSDLKSKFASNGNVAIIGGNVLDLDLNAVISDSRPARCVGNIPYYITSPILFKLLDSSVRFSTIVLTVQKEVADRIVALPSTKDYGVLTVSAQFRAEVEKLFEIPADRFYPKPKVDSAVIRLKPFVTNRFNYKDDKLFHRVVKSAFASRRKTMLNSILASGMLNLNREETAGIIADLGLKDKIRGEALSLEEFLKLTEMIRVLKYH